MLSVANRERDYAEADKDLLESIAAYISPILNARLQRDRQEKERNRAEEALRKREKELKEAQRLARIGSWDWDATTDTISWSEEYYRIYGFDPAQRPPGYVDHLRAYTPESATRLDAAVKINMETGEPYELDLELAHTEGGPRWITARSETKRDAQGRIIGLRGTAQDVTGIKRAETALRESEAKMRSILDNVRIGVALISPRMEILELNRRMREWFPGIDPDRNPVCYRVFNDPPRDMVCDYCPTCKTLQDGLVHEATTQTPQSGGIRNYRIVSSPVRNASGKVTAAIEMVEDVTEKLSLESRFLQAQKMESVGRLAGGVAHDFNNMLGVILGYTDMAMEQADPSQPLFANLQEVRKAAGRSADLTRQLLAFARKQTVTPKILDLNEAVEGMLKMLRRLIGEDINLAWLPGTGVWPVKVDPSQIDQILANLCVNARDAIAGVGKVTIDTRSEAFDDAYCADHPGFAPGEYVILTVSDNGCGMDKATLDKVFEPFFTTKEIGKGTGLGLATVYGIVKQNNGFISVYSEPGKGTAFKIYLPRYLDKAGQMQKEHPADSAELGHETILLVEDEPAILKMAKLMLERLGYRVMAASTPGQAISLARECPGEIHLLITDVVMPEMNGRDLAKNIVSFYPGIRRLFMSGYTSDVIAHHALLDEGIHFIQKPFSVQAIAARVREALDSQ